MTNHFTIIDIIMSLDDTAIVRIEGSDSIVTEEDYFNMVFINNEPSVNSSISWNDILPKFPHMAIKKLREERNEKIKETDQYGLADFPFRSDEHKQAWLNYRQQLRDLPANSTEAPVDLNTGELVGVQWPVKPM